MSNIILVFTLFCIPGRRVSLMYCSPQLTRLLKYRLLVKVHWYRQGKYNNGWKSSIPNSDCTIYSDLYVIFL